MSRDCPGKGARTLSLLRIGLKECHETPQILRGSFSVASTATIARLGHMFRIFRDLQDFFAFAPLRPQNFSLNVSIFFELIQYNEISFNSDFGRWLCSFYCEIVMDFCQNFKNFFCPNVFRKWWNVSTFRWKLPEKCGQRQKFPEWVTNCIRSFHFFNPILGHYLRVAATRTLC